jgi:PAS domain-containing protein
MPQRDIEVILLRQLASYLATPTFIVDVDGTLIYFNEAAEALLGRRFEETGEMPADEWGRAWVPCDENGDPLPPEELPLSIAVRSRHPAHRRFSIVGLDKVTRRIEAVAFPIIGQLDRHLGAAVLFWEQEAK